MWWMDVSSFLGNLLGRSPGSYRRSSIPAVVAICCRVPAGRKNTCKRSRASLVKLGLAHQIQGNYNTTPQSKNKPDEMQVVAGPTIPFPDCGGNLNQKIVYQPQHSND